MSRDLSEKDRVGTAALLRFLTVFSVAAGIAASVMKAATAPITTDEAWSCNSWVQKGAVHVWSDYSAANNHVLYNLLSVVLTGIAGNGEFVLRAFSLLGWVIFLVSAIPLVSRSIRHPVCKVACVATLALHPYLIDFAALARGYALMTGLTFAGMYLLDSAVRGIETGQERGSGHSNAFGPGLLLAGASVSFGMAFGCVPPAVVPAGAVVVSWFVLHRRGVAGYGHMKYAALTVIPGAAVAALVYGRVLDGVDRSTFYYGADTIWESLRSLYDVFVYVPQAAVNGTGNPMAVDAAGLHPWKLPFLPQRFYEVLYSDLFCLLTGLALVAALTGVLVSLRNRNRDGNTGAIVLTAAITFEGLLLASVLIRAPLPLGRTWLPAFPLLIVALFCGADRLIAAARGRMGRVLSGACILAWILLFVNLCSRIDFRTCREWPDNPVVYEAMEIVTAENTGAARPVTIGYKWYQNACFLYYKRRHDLKWLHVAPGEHAHMPKWDYILLNEWNMNAALYSGYRTAQEYPAYRMRLLKHGAGKRE